MKFLFLNIILFCFLIFNIKAQKYNFYHYNVENGLPQTQVKSITQDNNGILFIGTMSGLAKYNGDAFGVFTKNDGLAENWITTSYKDKDGNIWLGHWGGSISKYSFDKNQITKFNVEKYTKFKKITSITQDNYNNLWIGTAGAGIFKYDIKKDKVYNINFNKDLTDCNISAICIDIWDNIWVGTDKGLVVFQTKNNNFKHYTQINGLSSNNITCINYVLGNEIWIGTQDKGIDVIKIDNSNFNISKIKNINSSNGLNSNSITCITEDLNHNIWIGTLNGGVNIFNIANLNSINKKVSNGHFNYFTTKQGLNYNNINVIFQDRTGSMWIGTDLGLNQYLGNKFMLYNEDDGLTNNLVWNVFQDKQNNYWFSTNDGLTKIYFNNEFSVKNYLKYNINNGLKSNVVTCLKQDGFNTIWIGTTKGVNFIKENKISSFDSKHPLNNATIFDLAIDKQNNIWFATDMGAIKLNPKSLNYTLYNNKNGLNGSSVLRVFCDHNNNVWLSVIDGSLTMFDGRNFIYFDKEKDLKNKLVLCINQDKKNNLWFGTYGNGLFKYNKKTFTNYSISDGLSNDSPHSIIIENDSVLWIGTNNGIDKFNINSLTFSHYGVKDGFLGIETNSNAAFKDKQNNIWFGTILGAVKINNKCDIENKNQPITLINGLSIRHRNAPFPKNNEFSYNDNYLTFHFIGISLTNPQKVQYVYMLEGFDKQWLPLTNQNKAIYTNLNPGEYTFKVKAVNSEGIWNDIPAEYSFEINPPFWKTWWFILFGFTAIVFTVYSYIIYREKKLIKEKQYLETQVHLRTLEIEKQKDDLKISNEIIAKRNKEITDSIDYAKRIQQAILPSFNILKRIFDSSFIFYKPKDIVSGDFFWIYETSDSVIFAVADCTGHGVPGAFMSIIGNNLLKQAVIEHKIYTPNKILDKLNELLPEVLQQPDINSENYVNDGLEIAVCSINKANTLLQYSGTKHPLYLIRNSELIEFKGDRFTLGEKNRSEQNEFINHSIDIYKNDSIYIFSDGYTDQKGGPNKKKFMYKPFKELLCKISVEESETQKEILKSTISEWKNNIEQIDDMLIVGIKI